MKRLTYLLVTAIFLCGSTAWAAPSAKTVFTFNDLNEVVEASVSCDSYDPSNVWFGDTTGDFYDDEPSCTSDGNGSCAEIACNAWFGETTGDFYDDELSCTNDGNTTPPCTQAALLAEAAEVHRVMKVGIKMPKWKELLINVSLECGNFLETQVRSKGGDKNSANAEAMVRVLVLVKNRGGTWKAADPDGDGFAGAGEGVVFCHRSQELEAKFQGIFTTDETIDGWLGNEDSLFYTGGAAQTDCEAGGVDGEGDAGQSCTAVFNFVGTCLYEDQTTGRIFADLDCFEPEEIRLTTASMTANSFNFMYPNTEESGEHEVAVIAYLDTGAGLGGDAPSGSATAKAMVGLGSVSVQTVRMVRGGIPDPDPADCGTDSSVNGHACADLE